MTIRKQEMKYLLVSSVEASVLDQLPEDSSVTQGDGEAWICVETAEELNNGLVELLTDLSIDTNEHKTIKLSL